MKINDTQLPSCRLLINVSVQKICGHPSDHLYPSSNPIRVSIPFIALHQLATSHLCLPIFRLHHLLQVKASLTRQRRNARQLLALQQLQTRPTARTDMTQLMLDPILRRHRRRVSATNDHNLPVLTCLHRCIHRLLRALRERLHLEDTWRAVPEYGLRFVHRGSVQLDALFAAVEPHPAVGDALRIGGRASLGVLVEFVCCDVVDGEYDLNVVLLGFGHQLRAALTSGLVEE